MRLPLAMLAALAVLAALAAGAPAAVALAPGAARTLARVPAPGQPEGIALDPRDGSFWTGSNRARSRAVVWHFGRGGRILRRYVIRGHDRTAEHGINGIALDGRGRAYVLDYSGARAVRIDPATGRQRVYATLPDLPLCSTGRRPCEPSAEDRPAWPNWPVFDRRGAMYVSDLHQATIWKVPRGGGRARVWHQSADYASAFAVNGMQLDRRGRLVFANTLSPLPGLAAPGAVYRLRIRRDGRPGARERIAVADIPDGLAIGRSGRIYVALAAPGADAVQVVRPNGTLGARLPSRAVQQTLAIPFDAPASVAFRGTSLLVTNHALFTLDPSHFAVLELGVGERGLPLFRPR